MSLKGISSFVFASVIAVFSGEAGAVNHRPEDIAKTAQAIRIQVDQLVEPRHRRDVSRPLEEVERALKAGGEQEAREFLARAQEALDWAVYREGFHAD